MAGENGAAEVRAPGQEVRPLVKYDTVVDVKNRVVTYTVQEGLALPRTFIVPFWVLNRTMALVLAEEVKQETGIG